MIGQISGQATYQRHFARRLSNAAKPVKNASVVTGKSIEAIPVLNRINSFPLILKTDLPPELTYRPPKTIEEAARDDLLNRWFVQIAAMTLNRSDIGVLFSNPSDYEIDPLCRYFPTNMCNRLSVIYKLFLESIDWRFRTDIVCVYRDGGEGPRDLVHCHLFDSKTGCVVDPAWKSFFLAGRPLDLASRLITSPAINQGIDRAVNQINHALFKSRSIVKYGTLQMIQDRLERRVRYVDRHNPVNGPRDGLARFLEWASGRSILQPAKFSMPHLRPEGGPYWLDPSDSRAVVIQDSELAFVGDVLECVQNPFMGKGYRVTSPPGDLWMGGGDTSKLIEGLSQFNRWTLGNTGAD